MSCGTKHDRNSSQGANQNSRDKLCIVQFMHSGLECPIRLTGRKTNARTLNDGCLAVEWNQDYAHYRRLVHHNGWYVDENGIYQNGDLVFWTEWEAPTIATQVSDGREFSIAQFEHQIQCPPVEPVNGACTSSGKKFGNLQNTDPCVFGSTFKYSNCLQDRFTQLRYLAPKSLVLFGSYKEDEHKSPRFYLDTVFVVGRTALEYSSRTIDAVSCSDEYRNLTLKHVGDGFKFKFYRGVRCDGSCNLSTTMFSFTPSMLCLNGKPNDVYKRCILNVSVLNGLKMKAKLTEDILNGNKKQGVKYTITNEETIKKVWDTIVCEVLKQGFVLGVKFDYQQKTVRANTPCTQLSKMLTSVSKLSWDKIGLFVKTDDRDGLTGFKLSLYKETRWAKIAFPILLLLLLLALIGVVCVSSCGNPKSKIGILGPCTVTIGQESITVKPMVP